MKRIRCIPKRRTIEFITKDSVQDRTEPCILTDVLPTFDPYREQKPIYKHFQTCNNFSC